MTAQHQRDLGASEFDTVEAAVDDPERTVLEIDGITKDYGQEVAVDDLSLSVRDGELLTLLGPSGCGKTTTLRLLAGLERPTAGHIDIAGERVTGDGEDGFRQPDQRDVGIVFQDFALFPHLSVAENVAFGLTDLDETATRRRVDDLLELVDLTDHHDKMPGNLSGGQRQRVALARSLAPEPDVLLLDEPFSNLDVRLRVEMREEVRRILKRAGVTAVSVTHDQEEALSISDRVAIMNDGTVAQVGDPAEVFENPESRFVASFLGQASFLSGRVAGAAVETGLGSLDADRLNGSVDAYDGATVDVLVRPDDLRAVPTSESKADGYVVHRQYNGPSFVYRVELHSGDVVHCMHNHVETFAAGEPVAVKLAADHDLAWYPAE
ncbi:ABC transporter ATP-binding protein [Haloarcula nitratireducens]|uniref:Molybdate/tungstate import ATP-binding protein WtpC n=1 Tax=Haloarcula nitratireducens TaxID=2487749 RepID=A0AAW4P8C6_9EURY|nr:ABC transporter ATP-binding protein [Halomicroarcula nitratireducens]MBX0294144.1 ABC transporter ATP-binding protein [Halomicroarcula nitratireducens]